MAAFVASRTLWRAAFGVVLLPAILVLGLYVVDPRAGGLVFGPKMALIVAAEALFVCVLVQVVLLRVRRHGRRWYAAAYGIPFALGGTWFSDGDPVSVLGIVALTGAIGAALGLAQWTIVVWRNEALQATE